MLGEQYSVLGANITTHIHKKKNPGDVKARKRAHFGTQC